MPSRPAAPNAAVRPTAPAEPAHRSPMALVGAYTHPDSEAYVVPRVATR
jgi:hypothetical protein